MELTPLRYFRVIAEEGHMTRAARRLGVSQPALSAMLKKLEQEAGGALVHRSRRGVELTEAGRVFAGHADEALRAGESALRAVREVLGLERGSIRVGGGATAITYLLPPIVGEVRRRHPGLRFFVREAGSTSVATAVLAGELDLGIVTLPITIPESADLVRVPLVEDELRLIVPREHALERAVPETSKQPRSKRSHGRPIAPEESSAGGRFIAGFRWSELAEEPVVGFEAGSAVRDVIDRAAAGAGVTLNYVMEVRSIESIKRMVQEGIGVGFVSRFALREGEGLACRDSRLTRRLALIRRRDENPSPAAGEFEKTLLDSLARRGRRKERT